MTDNAPMLQAAAAVEAQIRRDQQPTRHSRARTRLAATKYKTLANGKSPYKITVTPAAQTVAVFPSQQENGFNQSNETSNNNATLLSSPPPPVSTHVPHNRHKRAVSTMLSTNNSSAAAPTISSMYRQHRSPLTQLRSPPAARNNNTNNSSANNTTTNTTSTHTHKRTRRGADTTITLLWQTLESKLIDQMKLFYGTYFMNLLKPQLSTTNQTPLIDTDALEARMTEFEVLVQVTSRSIRRLQQLCSTPVNTGVVEADEAMKAIYKAYKTTRHAKQPTSPKTKPATDTTTNIRAEPTTNNSNNNHSHHHQPSTIHPMTTSPSATALQSVVEEDLVYTDENVEESVVRFGSDGDEEEDEHLEMHDNEEDQEMHDVVTPLKPQHGNSNKHHSHIQNQFGSPSSEHVIRASLQHIIEEHEEVDMSAVMKRFRHARIAAKMKHQGRAFSTWQAATDDDTEQLIAEVIERQSLANQNLIRNSLSQYVSPSRERSMSNQINASQPLRGSLMFTSAASRMSTQPTANTLPSHHNHADLHTQSQLALLATTAMKLHQQWRILGHHTMQQHAFAAIVSSRTQSSTILIPSGKYVRLHDSHLQWSTTPTFTTPNYEQQLAVHSITQIDTSLTDYPTQLTLQCHSTALHSESYAELQLLFEYECERRVFVELLRMCVTGAS